MPGISTFSKAELAEHMVRMIREESRSAGFNKIIDSLDLNLLDHQIGVLHELEADAKINEQESEAISGVLNFLVDLYQSLKEK
jgi:hypothetical protein